MDNKRLHGKGWRLDYFLISDFFRQKEIKVVDSVIHDQIMGSDHCPI